MYVVSAAVSLLVRLHSLSPTPQVTLVYSY